MNDADDQPAVPVGLPVAWSSSPRFGWSAAEPTPTRETTTTHLVVAASSRVGRRGLRALRDTLSPRDWSVIRAIARHRYLTTRQLEGFCFADHATPLTGARVCRRVLGRLAANRIVAHLERRVGGVRAGSASYVWQLGPVGERLLQHGATSRRRPREPGLLFLNHHLAVADLHLSLLRADRAQQLELLAVQTEPACWRHYYGLGGAGLRLAPDLYVETGAGSETLDRWWLEVDLGSESLSRLLRKCARYVDYRHSGLEQSASGSFPLVVWVMQTAAEAARLQTAIAGATNLDDAMFRVTTADRAIELIAGGAL